MHTLAIDAYVEVSQDKGAWCRLREPGHRLENNPPRYMTLSVPHAIEHARSVWAEYIRAQVDGQYEVRVVDTDGAIVEQWPKSSTANP
jgi:hypothetical protein